MVQGLLSMSPSLSKSPPPKADLSKTPPPRASWNDKSRSEGISLTDSLKRLTRRPKARPTDEEASPSIKTTISGPSSYVPHVGSGWSPNEYLTLHNTITIQNPLIEHPAVGAQQFYNSHDTLEADDKEDNSTMISHKLRQLDLHGDYRTPRKVRDPRNPLAIPGE